MLLSFRFANHRSFRDEQQLNLTPVYDDGDETGTGARQAIRVAGIFGANASGKSNCLDALRFMRQMAVQSDRAVEPGMGLAREPFRLDPESAAGPSRYVVDLLLDGVRHTYGFTIDDEQVLEEWQYHYPLGRKRRVFERDGNDFSWGEESGRHSELEQIAGITAPTALFLSTVARFAEHHPRPKGEPSQPLHDTYRWFYRTSKSAGHDKNNGLDWRLFTQTGWSSVEEIRDVLVDLLQAADVGIVDVRFKNWQLREAFAALGNSPRLEFIHRGARGDVSLDLRDESTGTQQLLALGLQAATVLRIGGTMLVDEIDASLHPLLTAKLISQFRSPTTNPKGSQLVFTSHDAALLGTLDGEEILLRDEIWFTEKDDEGASSLYPLTDFKPRKEGENRQRRYLNGNYGAVPDLSTYLFEQALATRGAADEALRPPGQAPESRVP